MRALILSDVHANFEALSAVLDDAAERGGFDVIWSLGDLVGYGPDPGSCLGLLDSHDMVAVTGNHDMVAAGKMSAEYFNGAAGGGNQVDRRAAYGRRTGVPGKPAGSCRVA